MTVLALLKTIGIGFCISAVIGPIGLLCLRRTIKEGFWIGLASGIGAACADTCYSGIAIFSVTALSTLLLQYQMLFQTAGSLYLLYLGSHIYRSQLPHLQQRYTNVGPIKAYFSTFFLTLANPVTILAFFTLFASFDLVAENLRDAFIMLSAIFYGSCMWWILLAAFGHFVSTKLNKHLLNKIHQGSGVMIALFGGIALVDAIWTMGLYFLS